MDNLSAQTIKGLSWGYPALLSKVAEQMEVAGMRQFPDTTPDWSNKRVVACVVRATSATKKPISRMS